MKSDLFPSIAAHLAGLITPLSEIGEPHQAGGRKLVEWIRTHHRSGETLPCSWFAQGTLGGAPSVR